MATQEQLDAIEAMLVGAEKSIRRAFHDFLAHFSDEEVIAAIERMLAAGEIEAAYRLVEQYSAQMAVNISGNIGIVGTATAKELSDMLPGLIAVHFDPAHPRAAALIRQNALEFVVGFNGEQRAATRQALVRAYEQGMGERQIAQEFRNSIGLTTRQDQAVANYRQLLENVGSGSTEALSRALRNPAKDDMIERYAGIKKPLTPKQIDSMVSSYRKNYLRYRAETIARTEGLKATSIAREEANRQMLAQTGIDPGRVTRIWNATKDGRTRDWHASMNQQPRGIGVKFEDGKGNLLMYPGDPDCPDPSSIISCRCSLTYDIAPPQ